MLLPLPLLLWLVLWALEWEWSKSGTPIGELGTEWGLPIAALQDGAICRYEKMSWNIWFPTNRSNALVTKLNFRFLVKSHAWSSVLPAVKASCCCCWHNFFHGLCSCYYCRCCCCCFAFCEIFPPWQIAPFHPAREDHCEKDKCWLRRNFLSHSHSLSLSHSLSRILYLSKSVCQNSLLSFFSFLKASFLPF